jgi:hypothetical protein
VEGGGEQPQRTELSLSTGNAWISVIGRRGKMMMVSVRTLKAAARLGRDMARRWRRGMPTRQSDSAVAFDWCERNGHPYARLTSQCRCGLVRYDD